MILITIISNINNKKRLIRLDGRKRLPKPFKGKKTYQVLVETDRTVGTSYCMLSICCPKMLLRGYFMQ